jgi:hypothetical protein
MNRLRSRQPEPLIFRVQDFNDVWESQGRNFVQPVGWVERSDTHQLPFAKMMGFAKGSTHPTGCHRNFDGQRHGRF